jgi:hypothetical protein
MGKSTAKALYEFRRSPPKPRWVGEDKDGVLWAFPAETDGWARKTKFVGSMRLLKPVDPAAARGTGWQGGVGGGRRRLGGDEVGTAKVVRAAPSMWERVLTASQAQDIGLNEYVRRAIANQLAADRA